MGVEVGGTTVFSLFYCIFKASYKMELSLQNINMFMHVKNQSTDLIYVQSPYPEPNNTAHLRSLQKTIVNV